jgi:drug/metabolite transporter (DMT)-like permease
LTISGFLGSFFPSFLFAIAETEIDRAVASILNSLTPLNTILFGVTVFKIANTKRQVFGVVVGFIGTALLILKGAELNQHQNYLYAGFVLVATVCYAINVNIIKRYLQNVKPLAIATGNYVTIFVPAVIILCFSGFFSETTYSRPNFMASMVYITILSFFGTALAKVLFNKVVHMATPVFASSVTYLIAIVALGWGALDGEEFSFLQGIASIIILVGVYLSHKK